ncbi:MAG: class F sortase [Clostridiaceae bacterium]|nr:class F sortase [Eubacteriales bacterium]
MEQKDTLHNKEPKKHGTKWDILLIVLSALLLIGGVALIIREYVLLPDSDYVPPATPAPPTATPALTPVQTLSPSSTPIITPSPTPYVKPVPVKISFVEQQQSCQVFPSNVDEDGRMEVIDRPDAASWLELGPAPGEEGNAVVAGHRSLKHVAGTFQALWDIKVGGAVVIEFEDGRQQWFYVGTINRYPFNEVPLEVMDFGGPSRLTLITCVGDWNSTAGTSSERFVVVCFPGEVVYPSPTPEPTPSAAPIS